MSRGEQYLEETLAQMRSLIEPQTIAIIGASGNIGKVGGAITRNAIETSYGGRIYLVNPYAKQIMGRNVYPNLKAIPDDIELVEIVVPAPLVPNIMEQAVEKGVKGAIIISSGFAEVGRSDLQDEVVRISERGGIRIIGPNCFGVINTEIDLDLSFTFSKPLKGSIAFVSQSGAMCCGTLDWAYVEELGFSKFINLGNKCDVDETDALVYLDNDKQTKVIAIYLEGIEDGREFYEVVKKVSRKKPIIVLKAGISEPGARAALSHTASLAGRVEIFKAAMKQAGALMVDDIEQLFDSIQVFSQPLSRGNSVGILSNAGGLAVLTSDWCDKLGLSVPRFNPKTVEKIGNLLPAIASSNNPVDMTGIADYDSYKRVLETMLNTDTIDLIISIFVSQGLVTSDGPARAVVEMQRKSDKPVLAYWMGGNSVINGIRILKRGGVPVYSSPERVAKAADKLVITGSNSRARVSEVAIPSNLSNIIK